MQYDIDKIFDEIDNNENIKKLLSEPEFVAEYSRKVPTEPGGYIPYVGKRPMIAFKPFPYQEPEISDESMARYNCALSLAEMSDIMEQLRDAMFSGLPSNVQTLLRSTEFDNEFAVQLAALNRSYIDKYVKPVREEVEKNMKELYKKIMEYEMPKEKE